MEKRKTYAVIGKNIVFKIANKIILDEMNINVEKQSMYVYNIKYYVLFLNFINIVPAPNLSLR